MRWAGCTWLVTSSILLKPKRALSPRTPESLWPSICHSHCLGVLRGSPGRALAAGPLPMLTFPPVWTVQRGHDPHCGLQHAQDHQGERHHQGVLEGMWGAQEGEGAQRDGRQGLKGIHLPLPLLPLLSALGHRGPTSFPQHVGTLLPWSERHCVSARVEVGGARMGTQVGVWPSLAWFPSCRDLRV